MTTTRQILIALTDGNGNGPRAFGLKGFARVTLGSLTKAAESAGLDPRFFPPSKSDRTYARRVIQDQASPTVAYMAVNRDQNRPEGSTAYWQLQTKRAGEVGASGGAVLARFWMFAGDPTLHCAGDEGITTRVVARYRADRDAEILEAGQASSWVKYVLTAAFQATRTVHGYVVPVTHVPMAQAFMAAVKAEWPTAEIPSPQGLGVVTDASLGSMLAAGIVGEIEAEINAFRAARDKARQDSKRGDLGPRAAATALTRLADLSERACKFQAILPVGEMTAALAQLASVKAELEGLADVASQRFALLELDPLPAPEAPVPVSPAERKANAVVEAKHANAVPTPVEREVTPAPIVKVAAPTPEECRAKYAEHRKASGLHPDAFKRACQRFMADRGVEPTPAQWALAAQAIAFECKGQSRLYVA